MSQDSRPRILFMWEKFGPYHMDRCEACAHHFGDRYEVLGVEIASHGDIYKWDPTGPGRGFRKTTLFPNVSREHLPYWRYYLALVSACLRSRAQHIFLCGFEIPPVFLAAVTLRLLGRSIAIMQDSKFDDKERGLLKELFKSLLYLPYGAALVGSPRSRDYLTFLGLPARRIFLGYDALATERIAQLAEAPPAPAGTPHSARHFTIIARFVPQKNLGMALDAYAAYCRDHRGTPRELHLCGAGPLEDALKEQVARLGIDGVRFRGYLQEEGIAKTLASSLALILPSIEEPFGLVVNEALAVGVPIILADNCGARDQLVRSGVNGYVIEPDNVAGLAHFMRLLDSDEVEWARLAANSGAFRALAGTEHFVEGVESVLATLGRRPAARDRSLDGPAFRSPEPG